MSLIRIAARMSAVRALRGKTLVGDNVLDSQIGALDVGADGELRTEEDKPFISVYTHSGKTTATGLRALNGNGPTEFLFEAGVTAAMTETDPETGVSVLVGIGIPATDGAFEFHLDLVARQIADALNDPDNEWAEIWRSCVNSVQSVERERTSGDGNGIRLAAQQIKLTADLFPDPATGTTMAETHPLARFFAKVDEEGDMALSEAVDAMRAAVAGNAPQWKLDLRRYGNTRSEGDALLYTTQPGAEADVDIAEITVAPAQVAP